MSTNHPTLRTLLFLDAATCAGMGGVLALAAGPIARSTGLPAALLFWAGLVLVPIAVFMAFTARALDARPAAARSAARVVVLGNVSWVLASLLLLLPGVLSPTALGVAFVLAQAAVVALLAILEHRALRPRSRTA